MQLWKYEVIYILDPNSTAEETLAVATKVEQIVAEAKGTVMKKEEWGKRRLAYLVNKHREGNYVFFHVALDAQSVAEITRNLGLMEKVIKFQIVKDDTAKKKAKMKIKKAKVGTGVPSSSSSSRPGMNRPSGPSSAPSSPSAQAGAPQASAAPAVPAPVAAPAPEAPSTPQ